MCCIVMSLASKDILWIKRFTRCIPFVDMHKGPITLHYDDQAAVHNARNKRMSSYSKHIGMRYNHVRSVVKKGKVSLEYLPTNQMLADPLTKPMSGEKIKNDGRYGTNTDII